MKYSRTIIEYGSWDSLGLSKDFGNLETGRTLLDVDEHFCSCSFYVVVRDPDSQAVLFVQPYIKYRDFDPL